MRVRRLFVVVFILGFVGAVGGLFGTQALQALADWLVFDSECTGEPEVAALLMGGLNARPKAAAAWMLKYPRVHLVFARPQDEEVTTVGLVPNEAVLTQKLLTIYGIPEARTTLLPLPEVLNTHEEVGRLLDYFNQLPTRPKVLYLLTSWSHSRRAAWTAERLAKRVGVTTCMVPLRTSVDTPLGWWRSDRGTLSVFTEYVKSIRYGFKYGLAW